MTYTLEPFALLGEHTERGALVTLDFEPGQSYVLVESPEALDFVAEKARKARSDQVKRKDVLCAQTRKRAHA